MLCYKKMALLGFRRAHDMSRNFHTSAPCRALPSAFKPISIAFLAVLAVGAALVAMSAAQAGEPKTDIPNLIGTWTGENNTISNLKGMKTWQKTVKITSQTDRRFRGHFDYSAGRKDFFGVIYPDNISLSWVASDSRGVTHGRLLDGGTRLAACYVESGLDATAGCADLVRKTD